MTLEFFTYILAMAYIFYRSKIITKTQLKKILEECDKNSDKSIEQLLELMWNEVNTNEQ